MIACGPPKTLRDECPNPTVRRFLRRGEDDTAAGGQQRMSTCQSHRHQAFVLGASILLRGRPPALGRYRDVSSLKYRVVMYFDSAVTGLQKGAPVLR